MVGATPTANIPGEHAALPVAASTVTAYTYTVNTGEIDGVSEGFAEAREGDGDGDIGDGDGDADGMQVRYEVHVMLGEQIIFVASAEIGTVVFPVML